MNEDPLSLTYAYLWKLVEQYPPWADMVRTGNRLHLDKNSRNPFKETLKAADLPQVTLLPTEANNNLHSNSSSAVIVQNFTLGINAGELQVNRVYFPLKFYTLQALACFRADMGTVKWKGYPFLKKLEVPQATDTISELDASGNIISWDSLITISCEMWFPNELFMEV
jgi:hypothetical protein